MKIPLLRLHPREERRIRGGHPWVFANEIAGDLKVHAPGTIVDIGDSEGRFIGRGIINPHSLIAVRLYARTPAADLDDWTFYAGRLAEALRVRARVCPGRRDLRVVHAEGDGLPGLVIDRYVDLLAVQVTTAGLECRIPLLERAVREVFGPVAPNLAAVFRSEGKVRELEGLPERAEPWFGEVPGDVVIDELGVKFQLNPQGGQKTGHFFDQAMNRAFAGPLCRGLTVLDLYANSGGWALQALVNGATHATAVDVAAGNGDRMRVNAELNGVADRFTPVVAEAKHWLEEAVGRGQTYGAVVLDPPAFAKNRKTAGVALKGYETVNGLALRLVADGGLFFTSSCSYHVEEDRFVEAVSAGARKARKRLRAIRRGEQASDHPALIEVPETRYLKSWAFEVEPI